MKLSRRRFTHLAAGGATLSMLSRTAGAQAYPARPVHMIVPLTAGSAADILARRLAQRVGESWGQTVVVENRPGAGTTLGADVVAKAAPDGHTLLMNSAAFAVSAAVYQKLPYDPLKDFAPVSQVAAAPIVVVVAPSLGVKSIKDLIALAKAQPGQINFGSSGVGSSTDFVGEQLKLAAGLNVVHIPYKGPSESASRHRDRAHSVFPVAAGARIAVHQRREIARFGGDDCAAFTHAARRANGRRGWPALLRVSGLVGRVRTRRDTACSRRQDKQGNRPRSQAPRRYRPAAESRRRGKTEHARRIHQLRSREDRGCPPGSHVRGHSGLVRDAARGPFRGCPGRTVLRFVACSASSSSRGPLRVHNPNLRQRLACQLSPAADFPTHSLWAA